MLNHGYKCNTNINWTQGIYAKWKQGDPQEQEHIVHEWMVLNKGQYPWHG